MEMESTPQGSISEQPLASGMDAEEDNSSADCKEMEVSLPVDWESLSTLNGRDYFIVVHDISDCVKCWSLSTHYNIIGQDDELLMSGKRIFSFPGCKPANIYVKNVNNEDSNMFYVSFVTFGCIPVLKRAEVRDNERRRIGVIAYSSKVFTFFTYMITNELEGVTFRVKSTFVSKWDYEIQIANTTETIALISCHGPAHVLQIAENTLVSCSNKALFISLCLFLDTRRRYCTT